MLSGLAGAVDEVLDVDVSGLCDSEIRESFIALRHEIDRQEALASRLLAAAHHRQLRSGDGASSTPAWVQFQTGQRWTDAKASLDCGLICESLPLTAKAWAQGEISASAARTICRGRRTGYEAEYVAGEEELVRYAAERDFRSLDRLIARYHEYVNALEDKEPSDDNKLHFSPVGNLWAINGGFDALDGAIGNAALEAAMDKPSAGDTRSAVKRRADAFIALARFFLDHADLPDEGRDRPHLNLALEGRFDDDGALVVRPSLRDAGFTASDVARLWCDARITRTIMSANRIPLDAGRTVYIPSKALRRAVVARDGGCRFPGCDRKPNRCETHHVIVFPDGETIVANVVLLCAYHHHVLHRRGWQMMFDGITFEVTNPEGRVIGTTRAPPG